jgi:hypothetical protein
LEDFVERLRLVHQTLGFTTAFVVAPAALLSTLGGRVHRRFGVAYAVLMTLLYATGTFFTFHKHELASRNFARNICFNLLGYSLLWVGLRALALRSEGRRLRATGLDWSLTGLHALLAGVLIALASWKWVLGVIGGLGLLLVALDLDEFLGLSARHKHRLDRHLRYMLGSYLYVLTVLSIVHFPAAYKVKWIWPGLLGVPVVAALTAPGLRRRLGLNRPRAWAWGARLVVAVAFCLGALVLQDAIAQGSLASALGTQGD